MNSEPPSDARQKQDDEATVLDAGDAHSESGNEKRHWKSITMIMGILVVAGVGLLVYLSHGSDSKNESATPQRGLACPYLEQAAVAHGRGNIADYRQAINQAADVAEKTLQESGEVFGEPERIALELGLAGSVKSDRVERLLKLAMRDCQGLGAP